MIELRQTGKGVVLPIKALPGARRNEIRGVQRGMLKVAVTQVAEQGKANKALLQLIARQLELRMSQLTWIAGQTSGEKQLLVSGVTVAELEQKILPFCRDSG